MLYIYGPNWPTGEQISFESINVSSKTFYVERIYNFRLFCKSSPANRIDLHIKYFKLVSLQPGKKSQL